MKKYITTCIGKFGSEEILLDDVHTSIQDAKNQCDQDYEDGDTFIIYEMTEITRSSKPAKLIWTTKGKNQ